MEYVDILYDHLVYFIYGYLVYFVAIWSIWWTFGHFSHFGILCEEKSGIPVAHSGKEKLLSFLCAAKVSF
jgi:hypothetical protein